MVNALHLSGGELITFAIVYQFSQGRAGIFTGGPKYIQDWIGCSKPTALKYLKGLVAKGLIQEDSGTHNNVPFCNYGIVKNFDEVVKNFDGGSKESLRGWSKNFTENINNNYKDNYKDTLSNKGTAAFLKPSIEEVREYCQQRMNTVSPEAFVAFYESNGWKVGRNPMKDWRAAVRTWEQRDQQNPSPRSARPLPKQESNYVTKGMAILEKIQRGEPLL